MYQSHHCDHPGRLVIDIHLRICGHSFSGVAKSGPGAYPPLIFFFDPCYAALVFGEHIVRLLAKIYKIVARAYAISFQRP